MKTTWILIANNSYARFFTAETHSSPLTEIEALKYQKWRLQDNIMGEFKDGKERDSHFPEQHIDLPIHEIESFAHQVANYLEAAHNAHKFEQLLLVVEPSFIAMLRKQLPVSIKKRICYQLDRNITGESPSKIRGYLPKYFPA